MQKFRFHAVLITVSTGVVFAGAMKSGPDTRKVTPPESMISERNAGSGPVKVADIVETTMIWGATLSPSGKKIGFISGASGRVNLWEMNVDGTDARQLVKSNDRQNGPVYSPDGKSIVYEQDFGGGEIYDLFAIPAGGGEPRNLTGSVNTNETHAVFSPDGATLALMSRERTSASANIAVMAWPDGKVRLLTHEADPKASWTMVCWSPDGRFLFANRKVGSYEDSAAYRIDVATGKTEDLTPHEGKETVEASDVSPDGKTLLLSSSRKYGSANVALLDLDTRKWRWVTDTHWVATSGGFAPGGKAFTYEVNADGRKTVMFVDAATLHASDRSIPEGFNKPGATPGSFAADGSYLLSHEDSTHIANLYWASAQGKLKQITHNESAGFAAAVLPRTRLITYRSFDGTMISAYAWIPFNLKRDGTAAAVVLPHGGPTSQWYDTFNPHAVLLASRGFLVIAPNVRGSQGYGITFQQLNFQDLGGGDLKDEIAGLDFLKATGYVDSKKVGIWGNSYGGFMALMAISKYPDLWAAAVDEYGIINWLNIAEHSAPYLQQYVRSILGDPVKDKAAYEASSPLKYIDNEHTPLLVLQGAKDVRVPKEEAEQAVALLKARGRVVDSTIYPEEGHGFLKREHKLDELTRAVEWLERYLHPH